MQKMKKLLITNNYVSFNAGWDNSYYERIMYCTKIIYIVLFKRPILALLYFVFLNLGHFPT